MAKHEVNILPLGSKYSKGMDFQDVKKKKKKAFLSDQKQVLVVGTVTY